MTTLDQPISTQPLPFELPTEQEAPQPPVNVGRIERGIDAAVGMALAGSGLSRSGLGARIALVAGGTALLVRAATGFCPAYKALGINTATHGPARPKDFYDRGVHVQQSVTVDRPVSELYAFWRDFSNLPRFMRHLKSVAVMDGGRSHWVAIGPGNMEYHWDAILIDERAEELIAWRSAEDADVQNTGSVRFRPAGDRGTQISVTMEYIPPAGKLGVAVARIFAREPAQQVREDLRRFKSLLETGEIPTTEGQPRGQC